jgi:hypothetical protein
MIPHQQGNLQFELLSSDSLKNFSRSGAVSVLTGSGVLVETADCVTVKEGGGVIVTPPSILPFGIVTTQLITKDAVTVMIVRKRQNELYAQFMNISARSSLRASCRLPGM